MSANAEYILLSSAEWEALEGLPHFVVCLYLALKRLADFRTGIVGETKRISWRTLQSELFVEDHQGLEDSGSPTRQRVARAMEWLKKRELVQDLGSKKRGEAIVFKLVLSKTPSSAPNKPVQNPYRTRTGYPEQQKGEENHEKSVSNDSESQKPVQNPYSQKSGNPYDINIQYSIDPISNYIPIPKTVVTKHTSSSKPALSAQAQQVREIFAYWQKVMGKPKAVLDEKRKTRIQWALRTYGLETCMSAIDGCARSAWHMGTNDKGRVYNDITLIFRDANKVENFLSIREEKKKPQEISETLRRWMGDGDIIDGPIIDSDCIAVGGR